jgi:hypothetical protein
MRNDVAFFFHELSPWNHDLSFSGLSGPPEAPICRFPT